MPHTNKTFFFLSYKQSGFTFLWTLLLVAMMGFGLTVVVEFHTTAAQRDKEKELLSIGHQFRLALKRYYEVQIPGTKFDYPVSMDNLIKDNRVSGLHRHLRKVFVDPITGKAEWGLVIMRGRIVGIHSLSDKTPIKQDGFEADDQSFKDKQKLSDWIFTYPAEGSFN
jgi:type II secretory pathway pseudopilin PulG